MSSWGVMTNHDLMREGGRYGLLLPPPHHQTLIKWSHCMRTLNHHRWTHIISEGLALLMQVHLFCPWSDLPSPLQRSPSLMCIWRGVCYGLSTPPLCGGGGPLWFIYPWWGERALGTANSDGAHTKLTTNNLHWMRTCNHHRWEDIMGEGPVQFMEAHLFLLQSEAPSDGGAMMLPVPGAVLKIRVQRCQCSAR